MQFFRCPDRPQFIPVLYQITSGTAGKDFGQDVREVELIPGGLVAPLHRLECYLIPAVWQVPEGGL